jgi:hypothetical protein
MRIVPAFPKTSACLLAFALLPATAFAQTDVTGESPAPANPAPEAPTPEAPAPVEPAPPEPAAPAVVSEAAPQPSVAAAPAPMVPELTLADRSVLCGPGIRGCFLDTSGVWRSFEDEYLRLTTPPDRHYGIAAAEELAFVGVGAIWYFAALEDNKLDWDIDSLRMRFSRESVRYDSNTFPMNFVLHPLSGAAYYGFPRANGLSVPASFAFGAAACLLWEFGLEFNERLSINDLLTTPIGGMPLGEFFNRFARYLNSAPGGGNAWHKAFGYTLGINQAFHDRLLDHRNGSPLGTVTDALGYDAAIAHRFQIDYGIGFARTNADARFARHEVRILAELVAIPGYLRPGQMSRFYGDANFTRFSLVGTGGPHGNGTELYADAVLFGYYAQNIRATARGATGYGISVGSSVAYTYRRDEHARFLVQLGITHLPGLAVDAHGFHGRFALHLRGRLHGEFAGVRSGAYPYWHARNVGTYTRDVLTRYGYYFGWGYSARVEAEVEAPFVGVGVNASYGRYASHEGLDRNQEAIDASGLDVRGTDVVVASEVYLRVRPSPRLPLSLELAASRRRRTSKMEGIGHEDTYERLTLRAGVIF